MIVKKDRSKASRSESKIAARSALEEGEEDPNADVSMMPADQLAFDIDEKPAETLISVYEKFPLYIEAKVLQN